ncbi:MAG TPA: flagellar basal body protein [Terriglobia bacterium]|nr:flagellar basal body protein [Terriglobia bacterium]
MSWLNTNVLSQLQTFLRLTATRESLISNNIANVDTPGYQTEDISFEREMRRAEIQPESPSLTPFIHPVEGLVERPDGNNVNIDRESMLLAQSQLQYTLGVTVLRDEFKRLLTAINEGS